LLFPFSFFLQKYIKSKFLYIAKEIYIYISNFPLQTIPHLKHDNSERVDKILKENRNIKKLSFLLLKRYRVEIL